MRLGLPPPVVRYEEHAPGLRHADSTVRTMARLAREGARDYRLRQLATKALDDADVPWKDTRGEIHAIRSFIARNVRYTGDPIGMELVQHPLRTLEQGHGDCDDMGTVAGAMQLAIGIPTRYRTVGPQPEMMRHVFTEGFDRQHGWVLNDPVLLPRGIRPARVDPSMIDRALLGRAPHGFGRIYNHEGQMVGLGAYPHRYDGALWRGNTFYDSGPLGTPDLYKLPWIDEVDDPRDGDLALGECDDGSIDLCEYDELGSLWSSIKKIGKVVGNIASKVASSPIARMAAGIIPGGAAALEAAGQAGRMVSNVASARSPAAAAAAAARALPSNIRSALPSAAQSILRSPAAAAAARLLPPAAQAALRTAPSSAGIVRSGIRTGSSALTTITRSPSTSTPAITHPPVPALRQQFPAGARQLYDAAGQVFRIFLPVAGGALQGITERQAMRSPYRWGYAGANPWGLGDDEYDDAEMGLGDYDASIARNAAPLAIAAIKARAAAGTLRTPDDKVRQFQRAVGNLGVDGLYGANTRLALVHYGGPAAQTLPPRPGGTWRPPGTPAPAGHAEVGRTAQNPGLPPVGAPGPGAPSSPVVSVQNQPSSPAAPAFSSPAAEERAFAPPDPFATPAPAAPSEVFAPSPPPPVAPYTGPFGPPGQTVTTYTSSGPTPTPAGQDNAMMWLLVFWLFSRRRR